VVGAKAYRLRISPPGASEHHPVTLNNLAQIVELRAINGPSSDWNQATGTVTLNADGITGTIDANLLRDVAGAQPVHVTGKWACGAPLPLPSFDPSLPCGRFYALNQIHDEDVARMKASACHAEDLTFSGALQGHLENAITDTAVPWSAGFGDNICPSASSPVKGYYTAALKFSIGDESFLLDLNVRDPFSVIGPGQYSASKEEGVSLWWGHADPENQGRFETDFKIFWLGSRGTFTIAPDMKSGTVDASLEALSSDFPSAINVKGSWRCAG
jgi:hypothetical protein